MLNFVSLSLSGQNTDTSFPLYSLHANHQEFRSFTRAYTVQCVLSAL